MTIDPGRFIHLFSLERDTIKRTNGVESRTATTYDSGAWGEVVFLSGTELWRAQQVDTSITVRVHTWYRTDVSTADRVMFEGLRLEVKSIIPELQDRLYVTLECKTI